MEYKIEDIKKMNVYEKMSNITNEVETVRKNLKVGTGTSQYKAVAEKDVLDAVKDVEHKYRVYSYPRERRLVDNQILKKIVYDKNGEPKEMSTFYSKIETTYVFVNIDNTNERIATTVFSECIDTGDKGSGKGMTYADKYALLKAYKIETGDDPDKEPSPSEDSETSKLTLEEAQKTIITFGKYKGKNRTFYQVYNSDRQWLEYITGGDNPNQLALECLKLFDNMPINKLKVLMEETKATSESLLKKFKKDKLEDLSDEEIISSIDFLEDYKKQQVEKLEKAKQNTTNMLE